MCVKYPVYNVVMFEITNTLFRSKSTASTSPLAVMVRLVMRRATSLTSLHSLHTSLARSSFMMRVVSATSRVSGL